MHEWPPRSPPCKSHCSCFWYGYPLWQQAQKFPSSGARPFLPRLSRLAPGYSPSLTEIHPGSPPTTVTAVLTQDSAAHDESHEDGRTTLTQALSLSSFRR